MEKLDTIYNQVWHELKDKFDQDPIFTSEIELLLYFYARKFISRSKSNDQTTYIEKNLSDLIKSQFFQGYYVMKSMLLDEETELPEDVWTLNNGIVRNELPILMETIFKDNPSDWYRTDLGQSIGMKIIQEFDDVYDLVLQMRKDVALYGSYKAFIGDVRYQVPEQSNENLVFGNPFDLNFINPQIYMQAQFSTNEQEIWDLYFWSSMKQSRVWIGSIHFSIIPANEDQSIYLLQYTISETIAQLESYEILDYLMAKLPSHIKDLLQTRVYHVRELEILVPKNE